MATFVVATTMDNGDNMAPTAGSLRSAIIQANTTPGLDQISFAIGSGPQTISPPSGLPALTDPVEIDGTTQPGFSGSPIIELNGAGAGTATGLQVNTTQSTIKGLVVNRFEQFGIAITGDGNRLIGNFVGTDLTGTLDFGNGFDGVGVYGRNNNIGGITSADSNVISGNGFSGILISLGSGQSNTVVQGNRIGTDVTGTLPLGNSTQGIRIDASQTLIGGTEAGQANTIAYNVSSGVQVGTSFSNIQGNAIRGNSIFSNGSLGIDLGGNGVTPNDFFDFDEGPNRQQNFPDLDAAFPASAGTTVQGTLRSRPGNSFTIDFFAVDVPDPSGFGEGKTYLSSRVVSTDVNGFASFSIDLAATVAPGQFLTATATDTVGNTSEFSEARLVADSAAADLSVSVGQSSFAQVGEELLVNSILTNLGPARSTGTTLSVTLPSNVTYLASQSSQGTTSFANGVVTVNAGTLRPDQSVSVDIRTIPQSAGVVLVTAQGRRISRIRSRKTP